MSEENPSAVEPWLPVIGVAAATAAGVYPAPHNVTDLPLPGAEAFARRRRPDTAPRRQRGVLAHSGLRFVQRLLEAWRYVRTGGAPTRRRRTP